MAKGTTWLGAAAIFGLAVAGCTPTPQIKTVPVAGKVTYKGEPVSGALVTFVTEDTTGKPANGRTDGEGKYRLTTIVSGSNTQDGAMPGNYVVTVSKKSSGTTQTTLTPEGVQNMSMEEKMKLGGSGLSRPASGAAPVGEGAAGTSTSSDNSDIPERFALTGKSGLVATVPSTVASGGTFTQDFELKD
jgi:hypothetical protein